VTLGSKLLQILQKVRANCKTRNQLVINELSGPGEKSPVLFAANGSADVSLGHPGILLKPASVSSRLHAPAPGEL
jgi:hypothetical protein